jgi:hypothetical protein
MRPCMIRAGNRTKMFHVKRFCPIEGQFLTKTIFQNPAARADRANAVTSGKLRPRDSAGMIGAHRS